MHGANSVRNSFLQRFLPRLGLLRALHLDVVVHHVRPHLHRRVCRYSRVCQQIKPVINEEQSDSRRLVCDSLNDDSVFKARTIFDLERRQPLGIRGILPITVGERSSFPGLPQQYARLAKVRLSVLVVITAAFGELMCPAAFQLVSFVSCVTGTFLLAAAANGFNQISEASYDARMKRTKHRPLVTGQISFLHGKLVCSIAALSGFAIMYTGCNLLSASLGACNLGLYSVLYTSMKRSSIYNTWVGSVVGAIPPLMGWAAACGELSAGAWVLAGILYGWQFPHFNALSWNLRKDYVKGGYRMACNENPTLCCASTVRHSVGLLLLCSVAAPLSDLTTWTFAVDSMPLNVYMLYLSYRFNRDRDSQSARKLFRLSLAYLPILLILMYISKPHWGDPTTSETGKEAVDGSVDV